MVQRWWSFVRGEGMVHRIVYQTVVKKLSLFERIFGANDMYCHHIWLGMLVREHCHSFARLSKVNVAFAIQFLAASIAMLYGGIAEIDSYATLDEGDFHADWALGNAIKGLAWAILIIYPLMYVIKYV